MKKAALKLAVLATFFVMLFSQAVFADDTTGWLSEWDYTRDDSERTVTLNQYKGTGTNIYISGTAEIDSTLYGVILQGTHSSADGNITFPDNVVTITIRDGVKAGQNISYLFYGCSSLTVLDISSLDTSNVIYMSGLFHNCSSLTALDVSNFNTSNAITMGAMFRGCSSLTSLNVSNFNTANVADMSHMFEGCRGLTALDLSNFNTSNIDSMSSMFYGCASLTSLNLSGFNTSNVTNMAATFMGCGSLTTLDLSSFDTSKVTTMSQMFDGCGSLTSLDLRNFNTSRVTNMGSMFDICYDLTVLNLSSFDMSNVTNYSNRWMLDYTDSLTNLYAPKNVNISIALPDTFYDNDNPSDTYTALPLNKTTSVHLVRNGATPIPPSTPTTPTTPTTPDGNTVIPNTAATDFRGVFLWGLLISLAGTAGTYICRRRFS